MLLLWLMTVQPIIQFFFCAKNFGTKVVEYMRNRGKTHVESTGVKYAIKNRFNLTAFIDVDTLNPIWFVHCLNI